MEKAKKKEKVKYVRPCLTKHRRLKDLTADSSRRTVLGCTRSIA